MTNFKKIVIGLMIGGIITAMAVQIHNQTRLIASQSDELDRQQEENAKLMEAAGMQSEGTNSEHDRMMRDKCIFGAEQAMGLLKEGNRNDALATAYSVFPGEGQEDIPYTPQVAYALAESMRIYTCGNWYYPDSQLETDADILFMKTSQSSDLVLAVDESDMLYAWDAKSGELLDKFSLRLYGGTGPDRTQFALVGDRRFIYPTSYGFALYDTRTHDIVYECVDEENSKFLIMTGTPNDAIRIIPDGWGAGDGCDQIVMEEDGKRYLVRMHSGYYLVQTDTGDILCSVPISEEDYYSIGSGDEITFCSEDMFAVAMDKRQKEVRLYSTDDGSLIRTYPLNGGSIPYMCYWEGDLYLVENGDVNDTVYAIDVTEEDIRWTYQESGSGLNDLAPVYMKNGYYLVCTGRDTCVVLSRPFGSRQRRFRYNSEIVMLGAYEDSETFLIFTADGTWNYLFTDTMQSMYRIDFKATSTDIKMFGVGDDYVVTLPEHDRKITVYRTPFGSRTEIFYNPDGLYYRGELDSTGQYLAVSGIGAHKEGSGEDETYVEMLDTTNGKMLWSYLGDGQLRDMKFYEEKEALVLIMNTGIRLLDRYTGRELAEYIYLSGEGILYNGIVDPDDYIGTDATGRYVFVRLYDTVVGYDLEDGSIKYAIKEILMAGTEVVFALDPSMQYLAYTYRAGRGLSFYRLADYEAEGEVVLARGITFASDYESFEYAGVHVSNLDSMFFDDGGLDGSVPELYVGYRNGKVEVYSLAAGIEGLEENDKAAVPVVAVRLEEEPIRTYQDMDLSLNRYIHPDGKGYAAAAGDMSAYMLIDMAGTDGTSEDDLGQITAHIDGFLALDGVNDQIYLKADYGIYRVPIYDAAMLAAEAESILGDKE